MDHMSLTPNDLSNLVAIRSLRDFAASQARIPGVMQRQTAVLLLDGAIERSVLTACEHLQETPGDFDYSTKAMQLLRTHGWTPHPGVETDRRQLHRMRNAVQHSGVGVDPADLPRWVIAAEKFIAGVVRSAYGVEMDELAYSAAIEDEDIRASFDAAEAALASEDVSLAATSVVAAFDKVMALWSRFVVASDRKLAPRHRSHVRDVGWVGGDDSKVLALLDVASIVAIAPVPSEALWFLAAKQQPELLTEEEVKRALVVVFTFATAVEASPAARIEDRRRRQYEGARLVRSDAQTPATIHDYKIKQIGPRTIVTFRLADVPEADQYPAWSEALMAILNGPDPAGHRRFRVEVDGTLSMDEVTENIATDVDRIEEALRRADAAVVERREAAEQELQATQKADDEFESLVEAATPEDLPAWLTVGALRSFIGNSGHAVLVTFDHAVLQAVNDEMREALDRTGYHAIGSMRGYYFGSVPQEAIGDLISAVVREVGTIVEVRRVERESAEQALEPVLDVLTKRGLVRRESDV